MSIIEIEHLCKRYEGVTPLKDVNAYVDAGEVISIIGPSGTGKSTLIRCLNRLETPTSGKIIVDGQDVCDPKCDLPALRRKMGMVFQNYALFGHKLVVENLMMAPMDLLGMPKQEAYDQAIDLLDTVGLRDKALSWPHELSGGQRQRVAIARALAMQPKILLFDEPTSALDPQMVSEVLTVIKKLAEKGLTMLVVTHEMRFARDASTRVFYMDRGELWEEGPPDQIFNRPVRPETHDFVFRVHSWEWDVDSLHPDLPAMEAALDEYCKRQFMSRKSTSACQLAIDESVSNVLLNVARSSNIKHPGIHIQVKAGEGGIDTTLRLDYRKLMSHAEEFDDPSNDLSLAILQGLSERVEFPEPGIIELELKDR